MNKTIDFFIDSKNDQASFEYYFEKELNIKSVTLKSVMFYIAHVDIKGAIIYGKGLLGIMFTRFYNLVYLKEINLKTFCDYMNKVGLPEYVRYHSDKNHLIIELLENAPGTERYTLPALNSNPDHITFNELFGFNDQEEFTKKGKYRSPKSIIDTPPILYLRSNLVDKQNTFYNNKYSDIFCEFPVDIEDDSRKLRSYEPPNCTKDVYKCTNHIKFEITDENGKVINFRGKPVKIHLSFEVFPFNK